MKKEINYTWQEFEKDIGVIKKTALLDILTWLKFKTVIGISKGGLPLAVSLANMFKLPLEIIEAKSYKNKKQLGLEVKGFNSYNWESPLILVDDICDSGKTLNHIREELSLNGKEVFILTLFYKPQSVIVPDYYIHKVSNKTWVNFCWE